MTRIVSLLASGTEIVHALGLTDRLVGISHECDFPPQILALPRVSSTSLDSSADSSAIDAEVRDRMAHGEVLYEVDVERLVTLRPDVLITQSHCSVCAIDAATVERMVAGRPELAGVRIVSLDPTSWEAVFDDLRRVAVAVGDPQRGQECIDRLTGRVLNVRVVTDPLTDSLRPRVVCIEWTEPIMVAANWMPELIRLAGGRSELTRPGDRSAVTDWSRVVGYDPEVIVVMPCGLGLERAAVEARRLQRLPGWSKLSAVRRNRVYAVDGNAYFNRSGPRLVDSLELLAWLLHPDRFPVAPASSVGTWIRLTGEPTVPSPSTPPTASNNPVPVANKTNCCVARVQDLIFASRIDAVARSTGVTCTTARSHREFLSALRECESVTLAVVDMSLAGSESEDALRQVRQLHPEARVVAFFEHARVDLADRARVAGADEVLPRSRFVERLPVLLGG